MPSLASFLAILLAASIPSTSAFSTAIQAKIATRTPTTTTLYYHPASFERAVDCATTFGMCDIEELVELSEELDKLQGCFYESGEEDCSKEIDDRKDLADALLLQGELRERTHYIKEGNLFAYDVKADGNMHDRDEFFEHVVPEMDM
eukprot:81220_1